MTPDEVLAELQEKNKDAYLLEPRAVYDKALVDVTDDPQDHWLREKRTWVAVYDSRRCVKAIMEWHDCAQDGAEEWFDFNTSGAWVGPGTPTFTGAGKRLD